MQQRTCPVCGNAFTPTTNGQRFCPPTNADRLANKRQARSRCARRWSNAQRDGSDPTRPLPGSFDCASCGRYCEAGIAEVGASATKFCGPSCKERWKREHRTGEQKARWNANHAANLLVASITADAKPRDASRYKRSLKADPCAYCGIQPCGGIDHIEPTKGVGDRTDWTNMTGCCKTCNGQKQMLPLLLALPWIPLCRSYHDQRRLLFSRQAA